MNSKKPYLAIFLVISMVTTIACTARKVEDGTYQTGPDGLTEDATATDRAETTVAVTDTAALVLPGDTAAVARKKRL